MKVSYDDTSKLRMQQISIIQIAKKNRYQIF